MTEEERKQLIENKGWLDFREWVKSSCKFDNRQVESHMEDNGLDYAAGHRDSIEAVWSMILAFEQDGERAA